MLVAAFCFLCVIGVSIIVSLIFGSFVTGDFWIDNFLFTIVLYTLFFVVFLFFKKYVKRENFKSVRLYNATLTFLVALVCIAAFMLLQFGFNEIGTIVTGEQVSPFAIDGWGMYLALVLTSCIMPAVIEELIFRGVIFNELNKNNKWLAIFLSALLFSVFHLNPMQIVYQFIMGVIFAGIVYKTGNIIYPMIAHFINNFFVVTHTFIMGTSEMGGVWNVYTIIAAVFLAITGAFAVFSMIRGFKNEQK